MRKILAIVVLLALTISMTHAYAVSGGGRFTKYSFGSNSSSPNMQTSSKETSTKPENQYVDTFRSKTSTSQTFSDDSLTTIEQEIFEWLTNSISKFYNPSSVRVIEVMGIKNDMYYVAISATTLGGGALNKLYEFKEYSCQESKFVTISKIENTHFTLRESIYGRQPYSSECDVANINNALREYYEQKGWN